MDYFRERLIDCLCQWVQTQAWNLFEFLGWGGIVAIVAGLFLLFAICSRFSATLGRPLPMLLASGIIAGGLYFMVKGWNKPPSPRATIASKTPAPHQPAIIPQRLVADAAPVVPAALPVGELQPVLPPIPVAVHPSQPHETLEHHVSAPAHHGGHGTVAHPAVSGHLPGTGQSAGAPPVHTSGVHHPPASSGAVHAAAGNTPAVAVQASKPSPPASPVTPPKPPRPAKPKPVPPMVRNSGNPVLPNETPSNPPVPSPSKQSQALAARRALFRHQQEEAGKFDLSIAPMMQQHNASGHSGGFTPQTGHHSAPVHPSAGHIGTMHHAVRR